MTVNPGMDGYSKTPNQWKILRKTQTHDTVLKTH